MHDASQPPMLARLLGYSGLIPFISGALCVWLAPQAMQDPIMTALLNYAAIILAFMGAIHWGLAMAADTTRDDEFGGAPLQLGFSVIPALVGWTAVSFGLSATFALPVLLLAFIGLYLADLRAIALGLAPPWYRALRLSLTLTVTISLLAAWARALAG
ncbi:MAG: DUF3429 domain-containing protein [Pseudomonadota bacterium]